MDIEGYIKKLREKPEKTRYVILFVSIFLLMVFITVVWLTVVFWGKKDNIQAAGHSLSPFSVFKEDFNRFYEAIRQK